MFHLQIPLKKKDAINVDETIWRGDTILRHAIELTAREKESTCTHQAILMLPACLLYHFCF